MELAVRERLLAAESAGEVQALKKAYELIKSASKGQSALDSSDNISTDLYVLCAEQALRLGYQEISSDCLQMYFKGRFPVNQFLGRAYLCQGQLHAPHSTDNLAFEKWRTEEDLREVVQFISVVVYFQHSLIIYESMSGDEMCPGDPSSVPGHASSIGETTVEI